ncbi:MAG: PfkB family carbohydrate kinase [Acidobacteria bacterium]|nr:PfkB family carbohydrate kinase [Acidobacteriota bacterium]
MTVPEILAALPTLSALVVGDICLDRWCTYDPATAEPSRETGIPRIGVVRTEVSPGAGGTVANNLAALGVGRVAVLGAVGDDGFGFELRRALEARRIRAEHLVTVPDLQTFTYTKVINAATGVEDHPRLDFISTRPLARDVEQRIAADLGTLASRFDAILVADQAETDQGGVVTPTVREAIVVTHGGDGALLLTGDGEQWVKTRKVVKPVDICGAGDSFSAGAAMTLAAGGSPAQAARFGNLVASITIMKKGTGTASPKEVLQANEHAGD